MRKFEPCKILLALLMLVNITYTKAQIPVNDSAWIKDTTYSDDFGGSTLKTYKWNAEDSVSGHGLEMMFSRPNHPNVTVAGGHLRIKVDTLDPNRVYGSTTYSYQSGSVDSKDTSFKYGYLEISAKYPTGNLAYWPGFWGWNDRCSGSQWYNEYDICENGGSESLDGHIMLTNYHINLSGCSNPNTNIGVPIANLPLLSSAFHKYGLEWAPDRMLFYFDDALVRTVYDPTKANIPQNHMYTIFDIYVTNWLGNLPHMPADSLVIDYFNYYKLTTECDTNLTISTPSDYNRSVKNTITTNTSTPPTFNPSTAADSYTLRADVSVTLDAGAYINPTGTGYFAIDIIPCPQ